MRLTFVIYSLQAGGAERVMSMLVNAFVAAGHEVSLIVMTDSTQRPFYELDAAVRYLPLGLDRVSAGPFAAAGNNLKRLAAIRKAMRQCRPEVVVSFLTQTNILVLFATRMMAVPVVVCEHTDPWSCPIGRGWGFLRRWSYRWARRIVVLNERARVFFAKQTRGAIVVIPNPVVRPGPSQQAPARDGAGRTVVAMGRLSEEKGFDLLIAAFARLRKKHANWRLVLLGDGPLRETLVAMAGRLGLAGDIEFRGTIQHPAAVLGQADLFVAPSRFEGFPMALCEAMACGLPVISTQYSDAVREIIRDGENGILVPAEDVAALAAAMDRLMSSPRERKRLAARAPEITERYGLARVRQVWEKMFADLTAMP